MTRRPRREIHVLDWKRRESWEPAVQRGLARIAGTDYVERLRQRSAAFEYVDDSEPVFEVLGLGAEAEVVGAIGTELAQESTHFASYHACRTENVGEYYYKGILPMAAEEVRERFSRMFAGPPHFVDPAALEAAIAEVSTATREGNVHVVLDDRGFLDDCGHYLVYGGEYLHALAANVPGRGLELRDALRESGRATILCCHLPFSLLPERERLVDCMVAQHGYWVTHSASDPTDLDFTVTLKRRVPANAVKSHFHPVRIRDPYVWKIWNDESRTYEADA